MKQEFMGHNYMVYSTKNQHIAVTTYGGRRIRAVAKCAPSDTFDEDFGARLAMARCALKVEKIRNRNLRGHMNTWTDIAEMAQKELTEINDKLINSDSDIRGLEAELVNMLEH